MNKSKRADWGRLMLSNILVPLYGSPVGEAALPYAEVLARRSGAKLTLVRAARASGGLLHSDQSEVHAAEVYLSTIAAAAEARGFAVETVVPDGAPATWVPEQIELRTPI